MKKRSFGLVKMLLVWPKVAIIISTALNYKKIAQFSNWNYPILTASNIPNKAIRSWISEFYLIVKFIATEVRVYKWAFSVAASHSMYSFVLDFSVLSSQLCCSPNFRILIPFFRDKRYCDFSWSVLNNNNGFGAKNLRCSGTFTWNRICFLLLLPK